MQPTFSIFSSAITLLERDATDYAKKALANIFCLDLPVVEVNITENDEIKYKLKEIVKSDARFKRMNAEFCIVLRDKKLFLVKTSSLSFLQKLGYMVSSLYRIFV